MTCTQCIPLDSITMGEPVLACPVCGFHCVHPVGLECISPGTRNGHVKIDSKGIHLDPEASPVGRGVMITLRFFGECGHAFNYTFHFHKGSTVFSQDARKLLNIVEQWPNTIWRD